MSGPGPLNYEDVAVGEELGPIQLVVTAEMNRAQWDWIPSGSHDTLSSLNSRWVDPSVLARNYARLLRSKHEAQGMVHVRCEVQSLRPVEIGERLTIKGRIVEKYFKKGRPYIVVESVTTDENGSVVSRERNTLITSMRGGE